MGKSFKVVIDRTGSLQQWAKKTTIRPKKLNICTDKISLIQMQWLMFLRSFRNLSLSDERWQCVSRSAFRRPDAFGPLFSVIMLSGSCPFSRWDGRSAWSIWSGNTRLLTVPCPVDVDRVCLLYSGLYGHAFPKKSGQDQNPWNAADCWRGIFPRRTVSRDFTWSPKRGPKTIDRRVFTLEIFRSLVWEYVKLILKFIDYLIGLGSPI